MPSSKMPKRPWLSVLIPTYNGENYLPFALNSISIQEDNEIECIAIDDGSIDATISILRDYQKKLPIRILQRERQGNWVANTNYGLSLARGDYICFLHQDDLWLRDRLSIMRRLTAQFPEAVIVLHPSNFLDERGNNLGTWNCPLPSFPQIVKADMMIQRLLIQNFISILGPIFKREAALRVGGLDESLWYTADWDFWLKIAACGDSLYYPKALSAFRVHPSSQTVVRSSGSRDFREQLETVAMKHFTQWQAPERAKQRLKRVVYFSVEVNIALAEAAHGHQTNLLALLVAFASLGPSGWIRYIRDSRILERVSARLRAQITPRTNRDTKRHE